MHYEPFFFLLMFTNCGSFNKGAVVSGNKYNQMQYSSGSKAYTLDGHLCTMSHCVDVH